MGVMAMITMITKDNDSMHFTVQLNWILIKAHTARVSLN